jgi:hypothetical protein
VQVGYIIWGEQCPLAVFEYTFHEEVGNPQRIEKISRSDFLLAVVLSELKKVIDIHVPRLEVYSEGSLSFAATLVDKAGSVIEDFKHWDQSVSISVRAANVAVNSSNVRNC